MVKITYNGKEYASTIKYDGNLLKMTVFTDEKQEDYFEFHVDSMTCTTIFKGLTGTEQTNVLPADYLPVTVFRFFSQTGAEFTSELYDDNTGVCSIIRNVGSTGLCLDVQEKDKRLYYSLKIN